IPPTGDGVAQRAVGPVHGRTRCEAQLAVAVTGSLMSVGVDGARGSMIALVEVAAIDHETPWQPEDAEEVGSRRQRLWRFAVQAHEVEARAPEAGPALAVACLGSHHERSTHTDLRTRHPRPTWDRSDPERRSTAAGPLDVWVLEVEARGHQLVLEVEDGTV